MTEPLSERGTFAIAGHEALVPGRYFDLVRKSTCFIGHTDAAGDPDPRTISLDMPSTQAALDAIIKQSFDVFERDLQAYARDIDRHFGKMKPHERDGWTSWHFNTGGAFSTSAKSHWKAGRKSRAVSIMQQWNKVTVNGQKRVSNALEKRRAEEAAMILRGKYPKRDVPIYYTNGAGEVIWRVVDTLDFAEVKRLAFDGLAENFFARLWRISGWGRWFS